MNALLLAGLMFSPYVQPAPVEMDCVSNVVVKVDASQSVTVACGEDAAKWVESHLRKWYGKDAPKVAQGAYAPIAMKGDEAYELDAAPGGITIRAPKAAGVRYALFTLRQLAMPARGTVTVQGWIMPEIHIKDAPALAFRGMHLSWIKEYDAVEMERLIRMAAYCKFNRVVLENWGSFRSKKYPWWGFEDGGMDPKTLARLVAVAREEGVELIPQVQIFGHASLCRSTSAKHAILDAHPEYAPLFEPDAGWNWCLTNPNARRIIIDLIEITGLVVIALIATDLAEALILPGLVVGVAEIMAVSELWLTKENLQQKHAEKKLDIEVMKTAPPIIGIMLAAYGIFLTGFSGGLIAALGLLVYFLGKNVDVPFAKIENAAGYAWALWVIAFLIFMIVPSQWFLAVMLAAVGIMLKVMAKMSLVGTMRGG